MFESIGLLNFMHSIHHQLLNTTIMLTVQLCGRVLDTHPYVALLALS